LQEEQSTYRSDSRHVPSAELRAPSLTVVIPVFNEAITITSILRKVASSPVVSEIIVVDDGSTDGSRNILEALMPSLAFRLCLHKANAGKAAALRTGFSLASGAYTIIQDADLEYDPTDYTRLIRCLQRHKADAVFGSRFLGKGNPTSLHGIGNRILTFLSNLLSGQHLTDMETCYKVIRSDWLKRFRMSAERFSFEPEVTLLLARRRARIIEVPIIYNGRSHSEGKKIGLRDAFHAVATMIRLALSR